MGQDLTFERLSVKDSGAENRGKAKYLLLSQIVDFFFLSKSVCVTLLWQSRFFLFVNPFNILTASFFTFSAKWASWGLSYLKTCKEAESEMALPLQSLSFWHLLKYCDMRMVSVNIVNLWFWHPLKGPCQEKTPHHRKVVNLFLQGHHPERDPPVFNDCIRVFKSFRCGSLIDLQPGTHQVQGQWKKNWINGGTITIGFSL